MVFKAVIADCSWVRWVNIAVSKVPVTLLSALMAAVNCVLIVLSSEILFCETRLLMLAPVTPLKVQRYAFCAPMILFRKSMSEL